MGGAVEAGVRWLGRYGGVGGMQGGVSREAGKEYGEQGAGWRAQRAGWEEFLREDGQGHEVGRLEMCGQANKYGGGPACVSKGARCIPL
eukprot:457261-Pelagomonas_calceolata.AAC.2